jgi:hypothetical protein
MNSSTWKESWGWVVIYCHVNSWHLLPCQRLTSTDMSTVVIYWHVNSCHLLPCQQLPSTVMSTVAIYCHVNSCHLLPCQQLSSTVMSTVVIYCHVNSCAASGHHWSYVTSLLTFLEIVLLMVLSLIAVLNRACVVHFQLEDVSARTSPRALNSYTSHREHSNALT